MIDDIVAIGAHQHVWDPSRATYDWLDDSMGSLHRAIGFNELRPSLRRAGIDATVLVQSADNREDTELMLRTVEQNPEVVGVVAYAPLADAAATARLLDQLAPTGVVVGVRNLIHNMDDPDWLLRDDVDRGLSEVEARGLTFDVVSVLPRHLEHVPVLATRHPGLTFIVDHLSKPPIGLDDHEPWRTLIARASEPSNVVAKISGLYAANGDPASWTVDAIQPHLEWALEIFGADRLMYGGDWPISLLAGGYDRVWDALSALIAELTPKSKAALLGGTARRVYHLDEHRLAAAVSSSSSAPVSGRT